MTCDRGWKVREWMHQRRIKPVRELEPLLLDGRTPVVRPDVDVDKPAPVDPPVGIHGSETGQALWELRRYRKDWLQDGIVQPIARPHHRVAQPVRSRRKLHGDEGVVPPAEESEFGRIVSGRSLEIIHDTRMD